MILAYNLVGLSATTKSVTAPKYVNNNDVMSAVSAWQQDVNGPSKLYLKLEHSYSKTNVGYDGLKGNDKKLVDRLLSIQDSNCNSIFHVYLAILRKTIYGRADEYEDDTMDTIGNIMLSTEMMINVDKFDVYQNDCKLEVNLEEESLIPYQRVEDSKTYDDNVFSKEPDYNRPGGFARNIYSLNSLTV